MAEQKEFFVAQISERNERRFVFADKSGGLVVDVGSVIPGHSAGGLYDILVGKDQSGNLIWGPCHKNLAVLLWGMPKLKGKLVLDMEMRLGEVLRQQPQQTAGGQN